MEKAARKAVAVGGSRQIDLGISPVQRKAIAEGLANVLADTYTLYLKMVTE